jgi:hypothetical protein
MAIQGLRTKENSCTLCLSRGPSAVLLVPQKVSKCLSIHTQSAVSSVRYRDATKVAGLEWVDAGEPALKKN